MKPKVYTSPAKLNLFLHITGQTNTGYHQLQTIFQLLDWHDVLTITPNDSTHFHFAVRGAYSSITNNILQKVLNVLKAHLGKLSTQAFDMVLEKNIPFGTGLGGGSSNAATFLKALNSLWGLNLNTQQLMEIALKIGCDVPLFILEKNAWAEGLGEQLTPFELPQYLYLIIWPDKGIATSELYSHPNLIRNHHRFLPAQWALEDERFINDFTVLAVEKVPEIQAIIHWLENKSGASRVLMSGSGSAVFGVFEKVKKAECAFKETPFKNVKLVKGIT